MTTQRFIAYWRWRCHCIKSRQSGAITMSECEARLSRHWHVSLSVSNGYIFKRLFFAAPKLLLSMFLPLSFLQHRADKNASRQIRGDGERTRKAIPLCRHTGVCKTRSPLTARSPLSRARSSLDDNNRSTTNGAACLTTKLIIHNVS